MSMPPYTLWLQGHARRSPRGCSGAASVVAARGSSRSAACGGPAFGQYHPTPAGGHHAWALIVLALDADQVREMTFFLDVLVDFPRLGLPLDL